MDDMTQIRSRDRLLATASHKIQALSDKRALARSLFEELESFLHGSQFNNLDASIRFTCDREPVVSTLKHIGFRTTSEPNVFRRPDMVVQITVSREGWNPVVHIL